MFWEDEGFLLSKFKYSENSVIANFFTSKYGKVSGIIYGATSKKIKGYLQIGNLFHLNNFSKNENKISTLKVEIIKAITPSYFSHQKRLCCITCAMSMVKLLSAENQANNNIFKLIKDFFYFLNNDAWLKNYILWELKLLKEAGYDLNLKNISIKEVENNKTYYYVTSSTQKKFVPSFLIETNISDIDKKDILKGFILVGNYLEKNILIPNNIKIPNQRNELINLIKI